jgi:hypothetical protein
MAHFRRSVRSFDQQTRRNGPEIEFFPPDTSPAPIADAQEIQIADAGFASRARTCARCKKLRSGTTKLYDRRGYNPEKAASFFATY